MSTPAAPVALVASGSALLQGLLRAAEKEQEQLLALLGVSPADGRPLLEQLERLALLRLLLQQLQLPAAGPALSSATGSEQGDLAGGFGCHQIWCDGAVLYRVAPCHRMRSCCQLVPLNGASRRPLRRHWCQTRGLRRVA
ncbi:MAG: hypothetical protein ACKO8I_09545 [Cyanobacteriota bacterium]